MKPYVKFRKWIIGDALASTSDVFQRARIDVLFSFAVFFFLLNLPYFFLTLSLSAFHFCVGLFSSLALLSVIALMRITGKIRPATILYVCVHTFLNIFHFTVNNGQIEAQGLLFFILIVVFSFLMLDRLWGWIFTAFVATLLLVGTYNVNHNYSLFNIPLKYNDPAPTQSMSWMVLMPLLINVYLLSKFVKTSRDAENQLQRHKELAEKNNQLLELKNEDITSSILYAKRIQKAVLPPEERVLRDIPLSFIIYKPKDIVSGDFFWFHSIDANNYVLAVADCTGHG